MISGKKIETEKKRLVSQCKSCGGIGCRSCLGYCSFIDRMSEAEIPVDYWYREMEKFYGDECFKNEILSYMYNIDIEYSNGTALCCVGHRGTGKTMAACSILKQAILSGYNVYYTTMVEVVTKLLSSDSYAFRSAIKRYDFFVIDEVDQRFFPSAGSQELYGNHFENILRTRVQNRMPTIMCTNSEDINQIFSGEFKSSFESLSSQFVKVLRAGGRDVRKGKEKI